MIHSTASATAIGWFVSSVIMCGRTKQQMLVVHQLLLLLLPLDNAPKKKE